MKYLLFVLFALLAPTLAWADADFSTPSGNIHCLYMEMDDGPELSCDRRDPSYIRLSMGAKGRIHQGRPTDSVCCSKNILSYGTGWREGPFACDSSEAGLTCRRRTDGHGFFISRSQIRRF